MSGVVQAHRARRDRSLIANAIAMAFEKRAPPDSVTSAVKWFREFTAENGVNLVGWRLLLESPLGYWSRLLRQGHDETAVWVALLAGQSCTTPRLPSQFEVRHLVALAYENDVEKVLQHVPPQIWRSLLMQIKGRKRANLTEVSDVLAWAARTGGSMPKTIRRARWSSLRRHAFEHALSRVDCANLRRSLTAHAIVKKNGVVARRITNEGALDQLALVMRNCLRQYAVEVEAGNAVIYFALQGKQRAVILLKQSEPGGAWWAEEVKGPANLPAEHSFVEFAWELCTLWNSDESMRPKADGGSWSQHDSCSRAIR
jgi:hypothetical protein